VIRVLALVPYPTGRVGGQRYRMEQWARLLTAHGIQVIFSPFLSSQGMDVLYKRGYTVTKLRETLRGYLRRLSEATRWLSADVVFVYREAALLGPAWLEKLFSLRMPLVFDFDDALYLRDTSPANAWSRLLKVCGKPAAICRLARHVVVGNELLAEFAGEFARAVTVVPSTIDTDLYKVRPRPLNPLPVVGWTGSATTLPHLTALSPALRRLRERQDFELRVIGCQAEVEGVRVRCVPWNAETEVEDLRPLDVGLMPLPDDEWSRRKCGMKALQYMALGIPPVVSPVGVNAMIVRDSVNGFHARTEQEWIDRITILLNDESLRQAVGKQARKTVEESYSAAAHVPRVARILRDACILR